MRLREGDGVAHNTQWIPVNLDHEDMEFCRETGIKRQTYAEKRGFQPYGYGSAETHSRGLMGELALSRYLGVPMPQDWTWEGDRRRGFDVGGYQARTSIQPDSPLMIRPNDKDGCYAFLLTHDRPVIWLVGWMTLDEAKRFGIPGETRIGNRPVKYVAQKLLHPFPNIRGGFCVQAA